MSKNNHSKKSQYESFKEANDVAINAIRKTHHGNGNGNSGLRNVSKYVNLEQTGGASVQMNAATILRQAAAAPATTAFYTTGGPPKDVLYMRGEIVGNELNIQLISALIYGGAQLDVCNPAVPPANPPGHFNWTQKASIRNPNNHLIEIKEGKNIYSQQFDNGAGQKYNFCQNGNPGFVLSGVGASGAGAYYVPPGVAAVVPLVAAPAPAANNPGPLFTTKNLLIVKLDNTKVYNGNGPEAPLANTNMTEEIINYLLHQLVQYKLADNLLCVYEADKVTKLTVGVTPGSPTLTSYADYDSIRLGNNFDENVFSQCFEHVDKSDKKLKLVHAVTFLKPSDSSMSMKDCSTKNFNGLANLTKALAISNPFGRRLNEESIFYLCLRGHTIRCAGANDDLVAGQGVGGVERFISGTFGEIGGGVNLLDINNPLALAVRFDYIGTGVNPVDNGIGRFVVHPVTNELLIYEEENKKNTRLICYNYDNADDHNMIQPYSSYKDFAATGSGPIYMGPAQIIRNANIYQLAILTKAAGGAGVNQSTFANDYNAVAVTPITGAGRIAMHVSTVSTSEIQSSLSIAEFLFE